MTQTRAVLTMTTSPQRMVYLASVSDALYSQITLPDAMYINLPERYRNQEPCLIPCWLKVEPRVTPLLHEADDSGPIMKIVPALKIEQNPETLLITVDDDVRYPPDMISVFCAAAKARPQVSFGSQ